MPAQEAVRAVPTAGVKKSASHKNAAQNRRQLQKTEVYRNDITDSD